MDVNECNKLEEAEGGKLLLLLCMKKTNHAKERAEKLAINSKWASRNEVPLLPSHDATTGGFQLQRATGHSETSPDENIAHMH